MNPPDILLIDDNDSFRTPLRIALEQAGYAVTEACQGKQALALYKATQHAVVIADLIMPELDGLELIIALRKRNQAVKIIAITAGTRNSPHAELAAAKALGACRIFAKPFPVAKLIAAVRELLLPPAAGEPVA
jgi:CheY-like chemotaxis protein